MDFDLDENAQELQRLAAGLLDREASPARLEAHERERDRASEHPSTVRAKVSRDCAAFVPGMSRGWDRRPHPRQSYAV